MTWITPNYQDTDFSRPLSLDDKIEIFVDSIRGWQLDIADQCINGRNSETGEQIIAPINHSGFAVLQIVMSYFETVARHEAGSAGTSKSKKYFRKGLLSVFPETHQWSREQIDLAVQLLYEKVRNGLYHSSRTRPQVLLTANVDHPIILVGGSAVGESGDSGVVINPHLLTKRLLTHLEAFAAQLRDPTNTQLRANFERRYDFEASL